MDNRTLTETLASRLQMPADDIKRLTRALGEVIGERLSQLDAVAISSFGVFEPRKRDEKIALHPATGQRLLVPPRIVATFRPSPLLKQTIDTKDDMIAGETLITDNNE